MSKKKIGKHLQFYMDYFNKEHMPGYGLCFLSRHGYISDELLELFEPNGPETDILGQAGRDTAYWASDSDDPMMFKFTSLRQTIVLFMAAINNEL